MESSGELSVKVRTRPSFPPHRWFRAPLCQTGDKPVLGAVGMVLCLIPDKNMIDSG